MTRAQRIESDALFCVTAGRWHREALREIQVEGKPYFIPVVGRGEFDRKCQAVRLLGGAVSMVPRLGTDRHFFDASCAIWVRLETGAAAAALEAFEPKPTIVLQDGDTVKRTAIWWLSLELASSWVLKANERLSHALGGVRAAATPRHLIVPPGACIGVQEVGVAELRLGMYHPDQVVGDSRPGGRLADAPNLTALRKQHADRRERQAVAA